MKTLKRMLAVMLAVVMMMGLGVTSMAATPSADGKYTILVEIDTNGDGNAEDKIPVYLNADGSYTRTDGQTYKYSQPDTNEIENYGVATAFDALYATGKVNSFKAVEYLDTTTWEGTGVYGIAFDEFNGTKSDSKKLDSGKTRYYYWEVSIKDDGAEKYVSAQNYATNYLASNIQSVKVTYTYMDY